MQVGLQKMIEIFAVLRPELSVTAVPVRPGAGTGNAVTPRTA